MPQSTQTLFTDVVQDEVDVINRRRELVAFGRLAQDRGHIGTASDWAPIEVKRSREPSGIKDAREEPIPPLHSEQEIVGLACSGGGIRSAAFCLGVFQGLDSINANHEPQVLDAVDYLSTVSGGGYIGTSVAAGLMQAKGRFPFETKLDAQETLETKHIRDYSNYLAPEGFIDILVGLVAIVRGLLINVMIFLGIILAVAAGTVCSKQTEAALRHPFFDFTGGAFPSVFLWTTVFIVLFLGIQIVYAIIALRPRKVARTTLAGRESTGRAFGIILVVCALVSFFELQRYVLAGLLDAAYLSRFPGEPHEANLVGSAVHGLNSWFQTQTLWSFLFAAATALMAFGKKLIAVTTATRGDRTWPGILKHWASRFAVYAAAIVVPLLLWFTYLAFCYWGISGETGDVPSQAPAWLTSLSYRSGLAIWQIYAIAAAVLFCLTLFVAPNANSLHGYYRDRLSRAFLWNLDELKQGAKDPRKTNAAHFLAGVGKALHTAFTTGVNVDQIKLSSFKEKGNTGWSDDVRFAPYLLINTAVNLERSKYLNRRGRNADSFFFSPLFVGSQATGYARTGDLEEIDHNADLGTAMAISGAAASANMGASTIPALTFSLAALNVRLGYWLPNPGIPESWRGPLRWLANIGPWYFAKEALGLLNEQTKNVYLTDGGHFDNLGLYELLRRRCKVIIVADAEADPPLNLDSLIRLQRYARIDLGVLIDLPWGDIRRDTAMIRGAGTGKGSDDPAQCRGPHVAVGRIEYRKDEHGDESGVLIYIKASMTGDESDLIRDYHRRNPAFPHETTIDQFFSEEQFEVYRALGFHAAHGFFTGADRAAMLKTSPVMNWPEVIQRALIRLNIPADAVGSITNQQQDVMGRFRG